MQKCAGRQCFGRQRSGKFEWMEVAAAHVETSRRINACAESGLRGAVVEHARFSIAIMVGEKLRIIGQEPRRSLVMRRRHEPVFDIAPFAREREYEFASFFTERPQITRVLAAEPTLKFTLILAMPGMNLAAVASRCGKANFACFNKCDLRARNRQVKRSGESGIPAADDTHIAANVTRKTRQWWRRLGTRRVVALRRARLHRMCLQDRACLGQAGLDRAAAACDLSRRRIFPRCAQ